MDLWWEQERFEDVLKALGVVDAHASLGMWEYLKAHDKVDDGKWGRESLDTCVPDRALFTDVIERLWALLGTLERARITSPVLAPYIRLQMLLDAHVLEWFTTSMHTFADTVKAATLDAYTKGYAGLEFWDDLGLVCSVLCSN
jgi:hypothetical protein